MPFDFKAYDAKCAGLNPSELQKEWNHYTRLISGGATSTAISGLAIPLTAGVSSIGVALAAPGIHNARKKREIIERHLQKHGTTHETRKRDVLGSMAFSGTVGVVTLGAGSLGAESIMTNGAEHGMVLCETGVKVATHVVGDAVGMGVEHAHTSHQKKKDMKKLFAKEGTFQAVKDAKAAEAGYTLDDGQGQQMVHGEQYNYHHHHGSIAGPSSGGAVVVVGGEAVIAGGGVIMAQQLLPPPPPLYAPHDPLQPVPPPPSYGYSGQQQEQYVLATGDSKAPMVYVAAQEQRQLPSQQPFDPYAQYYQQTEASVASGVVMTPTGGSSGVMVQEYQTPSQKLVWDDEKGQYQQQQQQTSAPTPTAVFEMAALEQALPPLAVSAQVSQNATGSTSTTSTISPTATSISQSHHSIPTRSSTLVSQCSSTYSVTPGYCPTPRQSVSYPPPPPRQHDTSGHSDQTQRPTSVYQPHLQQPVEQASVSAVHTPQPPAQSQFTVPNYNPTAQATIQHPQYIPTPPATSPIPQYQPHRENSLTEKQERPVSAMYFAPPPEQPKSKRMSMMHSVSSMIDQVKASQAEQTQDNQQQQQQVANPSIPAYNPATTQAETASLRPQATPIQQYHPQQSQYVQQTQHQHPHQPLVQLPGSQMPPTPLSPPFTPAPTGTISTQHTGGMYQTYPSGQQPQPVVGGYFPPPPPGGPPPSTIGYQPQQQQYLLQKLPEPQRHNNHGYQQQPGQTGILTPMATPSGAEMYGGYQPVQQQPYQGQLQGQYYQSA